MRRIATGLCIVLAVLFLCNFSSAETPQEEWNRAAALFEEGQKRANISDFRGAIEKWEAALVTFQKLGKKQAISAVLGSLGNAYSDLGDYRKAIDYYEKALAIAGEFGDKKNKEFFLGNLGSAYRYLGDYRKAIDYHEKALAISEEIGDKQGKGAVLGNLGLAYRDLGDHKKSIVYLEKALAIAEEIGDKKGKGIVLDHLGDAHRYLGDYRKVIDYTEKALAIDEEIGEKKGKRKHIASLGIAYSFLGHYKKAVVYLEKTLAIAEEIGEKNTKGIVLDHLGLTYGKLGDYKKAIDYHEKAVAIAEEIGDKKSKGQYIANLGLTYDESRDYRKAIDYNEKALAIAEDIGDKNGKGSRLGNLGITYSKLGDYRKAIDYLEKALAIAEEIGDKKVDDKRKKEAHIGNLGVLYSQIGDYRKGIVYFEKALAIAEEIGSKHSKAIYLNNIGNAYSDLGEYRRATDYLEKAVAIAEEIGDKESKGQYIANLADAYLALDRDEDAFAIYTKGNQSVRLGFYYLKKKDFKEAVRQFDRNREEDEKDKSASLIIPQWIGLGLSHEGLKEYAEAYRWYNKAIAFMEAQRDSLASAEREHYYEGNEFKFPRIEAYEGAVRCAFMLGKFDEAFYWAENTRGRMLSELLSKRHSGENYKIPGNLAEEEENLTNKIMMNKKQQQTAFEKNNPEHLKQLEEEYPALRAKMDKLIDRLRKEYSQYASIKYPQPAKLSQLNLKKGEIIVEYEVTAPYTMGFVIRDGKVIKAFKVDKTRTELASMVTKYRAPFQDGADISGVSLNLAANICDLLIKPTLSEVKKGQSLIIIPDESLSLLPFEALVFSVPDTPQKTSASKEIVYAMDEFPISYYQSASVLSLQRGLALSRAKEKSFFGLGDPVYGKEDKRTASLRGIKLISKQTQDITDSEATKEAGYKFERLLNTAKEVKEVSKLFGQSIVLLGTDASEEKVKKEDLTKRKYVLFSTHGILGNEIPYIKQPALVFNLVGNDTEDGFLTASEIFNMNLNADLVGLSACKTGLGVQSAGEGIVGLSRAFMYAGTDTVLVSLWSVADDSTYKLMVKFFEGLNSGKDKLTALKEAKNYLRNNGNENPFYWAPFILIGETN